jgi:hypothetical protein
LDLYALLAGLPEVMRLYASTAPALMALPTFECPRTRKPGSDEYVSLALLLAPMAGVLQLALGVLSINCQSVNSIDVTTTRTSKTRYRETAPRIYTSSLPL